MKLHAVARDTGTAAVLQLRFPCVVPLHKELVPYRRCLRAAFFIAMRAGDAWGLLCMGDV